MMHICLYAFVVKYAKITIMELHYFHLQVTAVGINTEWGLLMASISEDTGEETPLQVNVLTFVA